MRVSLPIVVAALLFFGLRASADAPGAAEIAADEKILTEAHVAHDGPSLIQYFRKRSLTEEDLARLEQTVRRLGAPLCRS